MRKIGIVLNILVIVGVMYVNLSKSTPYDGFPAWGYLPVYAFLSVTLALLIKK